jgi:hypothetical protein
MQLHANAADDADAFAEVDLRVARRMKTSRDRVRAIRT